MAYPMGEAKPGFRGTHLSYGASWMLRDRDTFIDGHGLDHGGLHRAVRWTESVGCARAGSASRVVMADPCRPTPSHSHNPYRYYFFRIYRIAY